MISNRANHVRRNERNWIQHV